MDHVMNAQFVGVCLNMTAALLTSSSFSSEVVK